MAGFSTRVKAIRQAIQQYSRESENVGARGHGIGQKTVATIGERCSAARCPIWSATFHLVVLPQAKDHGCRFLLLPLAISPRRRKTLDGLNDCEFTRIS